MWNQYYDLKLTELEIQKGLHRSLVGGMWRELGEKQFSFLKDNGLEPHHSLLDVGCGSLRGGIFFIKYLNEGKYSGLDINHSLIRGGEAELKKANLLKKKPMLLVNDSFHFQLFKNKFDFAIAQSVFSHLPLNVIQKCLVNMEKVLNPGGKFYATFFETKEKFNDHPVKHSGGLTTYLDKDPYHYHLSLFEYLIKDSFLELEYIGEWGHPRNQRMICFHKMETPPSTQV
ncbi:class I SAM-dependent methyltransferase [Bacillus sp. OK048]|uniref:class I SAM-dependent methyltransferase n=1 Tax=Bacillus sp. OK048 TaxID=1882761 RepID=UPI000882DA81|nr:class I SAM-dependent methyltransferase [Bacillus sp. OK048]SDN52625.1 Methyltransferase domain-containing protein [Bacillus sp. OK048]